MSGLSTAATLYTEAQLDVMTHLLTELAEHAFKIAIVPSTAGFTTASSLSVKINGEAV